MSLIGLVGIVGLVGLMGLMALGSCWSSGFGASCESDCLGGPSESCESCRSG